jgi:hypothetical protein
MARTRHRAAFVTARPEHDDSVPLWLQQRLRVEKGPRSLVMVAGDQPAARFARLAERAAVDVDKVLPGWHGSLVVEVPATLRGLGRTLHASPNAYAEIAAVTTTVDGSDRRSAPTHIFVNPEVFDPLGPHGSQIVMSHEATHVATHAATSTMPTWLLEGFADFVALDHVDLPVSVSASQIVGQVRRKGVPHHLPGPADFASSNTALGASYESAWLACRLLAAEYGEQRLIRFYRQADRDGSTTRAFARVLGTDKRAFTVAWQRYLRRLS